MNPSQREPDCGGMEDLWAPGEDEQRYAATTLEWRHIVEHRYQPLDCFMDSYENYRGEADLAAKRRQLDFIQKYIGATKWNLIG